MPPRYLIVKLRSAGTLFAILKRRWDSCDRKSGGFMVNEIELFYIVLLVLLTFVIHLIISATGSGRDGKHRR
jgi:hypothetical protein